MSVKSLPARDYVSRLLEYDPDTGIFIWRPRSRDLFDGLRAHAVWNVRYAGKIAGCTTPFGYRVINIHCSLYLAHRLAWLLIHGEPVPPILDHIDRDKLNNRIANLREANEVQNHANSGVRKSNKLGIKGVWRHHEKYRARIEINRETIHLGLFDTAEQAAQAYHEASFRTHGEFACPKET